ncbi:hypothetical protein LAZ67_2002876 [Cordylochernes scorpioides]|uniref:Mos1 transposase HTH domain-containing protein n=1 Tax=Cordylochernes scorpioides TaxID=51811 RepID=A0ABY6K3H1_9ARAC|nr:hypothetical protein LAZ67_2002876 [Cordylochernes scorpioides]
MHASNHSFEMHTSSFGKCSFSGLLQLSECFDDFLDVATSRQKLLRVIIVYDDHALTERTCQKWFARFERGNFYSEDEETPGAPPKSNTNAKGTLKTLGVTQPAIFHRLKNRNVPKGRKLSAV